jgi:hypothetical protein
MKEPFKVDYLWAALCMVAAVYFIFRAATLAIQPAPPGLRAEETFVVVDVPLGSTPHMTGMPLVPLWPVR